VIFHRRCHKTRHDACARCITGGGTPRTQIADIGTALYVSR
jgi:hypothetical protein